MLNTTEVAAAGSATRYQTSPVPIVEPEVQKLTPDGMLFVAAKVEPRLINGARLIMRGLLQLSCSICCAGCVSKPHELTEAAGAAGQVAVDVACTASSR